MEKTKKLEVNCEPHLSNVVVQVPLVKDTLTFDARQTQRLKDIEKHLESEMKRKRRDWEREVARMREEFLHLYPINDQKNDCNKDRNIDNDDQQQQQLTDKTSHPPYVSKRRGSTDVLDLRKMRTLIVDSPETGRKFKVRFNVSGFDPRSIQVSTDGDRIIVKATKLETDETTGDTIKKDYDRKIQKPKDTDHTKFKSYLTSDSVLIVEAPLPPSNHDLRRAIHSPSHSQHAPATSSHHASPSRSCSPSNSVGTETPPAKEKYGVPIFREENGLRRMHLVIELGTAFSPSDIFVQVVKDNRILVKAKHEEKTTERLSKNKFSKEFELGEKIDTYSLTASLEADGKLIVGASVKVHGKKSQGHSEDQPTAEDDSCSANNSKPSTPLHSVIVGTTKKEETVAKKTTEEK